MRVPSGDRDGWEWGPRTHSTRSHSFVYMKGGHSSRQPQLFPFLPLLASYDVEWFNMALKLGRMLASRGSWVKKISLPEFSTRDSDVIDLGCGLDTRTVKWLQVILPCSQGWELLPSSRCSFRGLLPSHHFLPNCLKFIWDSTKTFHGTTEINDLKCKGEFSREMAESLSYTLHQSAVRCFYAFLARRGLEQRGRALVVRRQREIGTGVWRPTS